MLLCALPVILLFGGLTLFFIASGGNWNDYL